MALERRAYTGRSAHNTHARRHAPPCRRAAVVSTEALDANPGGAATGEVLGGRSNYSNESFED